MTEYIVLKSIDPKATGDWREYAQREAPSGDAAIRLVLAQHPGDGVYIAVPKRSWRPIVVTTETKTVVKFGGHSTES